MPFSRDTIGSDPLFLEKAHTDKVHTFLEAVELMKVFPEGLCTVIVTPNAIGLNFDIAMLRGTEVTVTGVLNGSPASGVAYFKELPAAL